jgi:hypothetical protein
MRVLATPPGFPAEVPLDALSKVPIDRGSLRKTRTKANERGRRAVLSDCLSFSADAHRPQARRHPRPRLPHSPQAQGRRRGPPCPSPTSGRTRSRPATTSTPPPTKSSTSMRGELTAGWTSSTRCAPRHRNPHPDRPLPPGERQSRLRGRCQAQWRSAVPAASGDRRRRGHDGAAQPLSLCIEPDYVDEKGRKWGDVFTHSAFTPVPVVSGMGSFVPFAASRDRQTETPIFYLSADERNPDMDFKQLREALGATADVPDDQAFDQGEGAEDQCGHRAVSRHRRRSQGDGVGREGYHPLAHAHPARSGILRDRMELSVGKINLASRRAISPPSSPISSRPRWARSPPPAPSCCRARPTWATVRWISCCRCSKARSSPPYRQSDRPSVAQSGNPRRRN